MFNASVIRSPARHWSIINNRASSFGAARITASASSADRYFGRSLHFRLTVSKDRIAEQQQRGRSKSVPPRVIGQGKCPCQLFRENVTKAMVEADGCGIWYGLRGDSCVVRDLGSNALPAVLETVAVPVHLQDVDAVSEAIQQRAGEPLRAEDLGPFVEG